LSEQIDAAEPIVLPIARATWNRGRAQNTVRIFSSPDALGMVDIEFEWSGDRQRVHKSHLVNPNEAAARLLSLGDRVIEVSRPGLVQRRPATVAPAAAPPKPKPAPLPGARIERDVAEVLFGKQAVLGVPLDARLRLLGCPDGRVVLRAYDQQGLIRERPYQYLEDTGADLAALKRRKQLAVALISTQKQADQSIGRKTLYKLVHPELGVAMSEVNMTADTMKSMGGPVLARAAIYAGRRDGLPVPGKFAFAISINTAARGKERIYISALRLFKESRTVVEIWAFLSESDMTAMEFRMNGLGFRFEFGVP
jgi:hypothetical protein